MKIVAGSARFVHAVCEIAKNVVLTFNITSANGTTLSASSVPFNTTGYMIALMALTHLRQASFQLVFLCLRWAPTTTMTCRTASLRWPSSSLCVERTMCRTTFSLAIFPATASSLITPTLPVSPSVLLI
jgi:hypothetical protein